MTALLFGPQTLIWMSEENISIYAYTLVSGRIKRKFWTYWRFVLVSRCGCLSCAIALHIFCKQPQRILPIFGTFLKCDFCLLAEMSVWMYTEAKRRTF